MQSKHLTLRLPAEMLQRVEELAALVIGSDGSAQPISRSDFIRLAVERLVEHLEAGGAITGTWSLSLGVEASAGDSGQ